MRNRKRRNRVRQRGCSRTELSVSHAPSIDLASGRVRRDAVPVGRLFYDGPMSRMLQQGHTCLSGATQAVHLLRLHRVHCAIHLLLAASAIAKAACRTRAPRLRPIRSKGARLYASQTALAASEVASATGGARLEPGRGCRRSSQAAAAHGASVGDGVSVWHAPRRRDAAA